VRRKPLSPSYPRGLLPHPAPPSPRWGRRIRVLCPPSPGGAFLSNDEIAARPDHYALGKAGPPECLPATMQVVASRRAPAEWENVH
jgi:hypothetical protein